MLTFFKIVIIIYIVSCIGIYFVQRSLIYHPSSFANKIGKIITIKNDQNINILAANTNKSKVIIYFGGNAENVNYSISDYINNFSEYAIYMMNYRGFNGSGGSPNEKNLIADANKLFDLIEKNYTEIIVIGRSLGSGIAIQLAAQKQIDKLVLITPFRSLLDIAKRQYWFFPVNILLKDKYLSYQFAPKIKAKTLILIAGEDEIIPPENSIKLVNYFSNSLPEYKIFKGENHNSLSNNIQFYPTMQNFINQE